MRGALILGLALVGCGPDLPDPMDAPHYPEGSIFRLTADLVNQDGAEHDLSIVAGHPTLMSMIYTTCPTACPMLINDIKGLEGKLSPAAREDVRVLLVSMDPETDGAQQLNALAVAHGLDTSRWTLSVASPTQTRAIAESLDIQFSRRVDGEMDHTTLLALLDRDGRQLAVQYGLGKDSAQFVARLEGLTKRR
ncbi:MAG: protein SCO1/2 [Myxococcota bacterium]|jgi:protein SCO1/2